MSQYNLSEHKFYPAKLLFKDELLGYYFIQWGKQVDLSFGNCTYALRNRRKYPTNYTDPEPIFEFWESERISASELKIRDRDDDNRRSIEFMDKGKDLIIKDYVFPQEYDFFYPLLGADKFIIEPLAQELKEAGISGIEIMEVDDRRIAFLHDKAE